MPRGREQSPGKGVRSVSGVVGRRIARGGAGREGESWRRRRTCIIFRSGFGIWMLVGKKEEKIGDNQSRDPVVDATAVAAFPK